ncbi:hypothetical protein IE4771_PB00211 (plasmid) [Rhizobium etli bv. mimosae str. IE4771]|uniref:Uncharacterized protein n=1 Tax=Rhizobium etli bv. mimosae str. IE4771 TaxID=1432050 RepID=A0A060IE15_RHIET|nr:hypothetical protein IE4771_PB00211 [Rhizobium sp. IE4771]
MLQSSSNARHVFERRLDAVASWALNKFQKKSGGFFAAGTIFGSVSRDGGFVCHQVLGRGSILIAEVGLHRAVWHPETASKDSPFDRLKVGSEELNQCWA